MNNIEAISQIVRHIEIHPNSDQVTDGFNVTFRETPVEMLKEPPLGMTYVNHLYSAPCGSDGGGGGYYHGERFHKDIKEQEKLEENLQMMFEQGIKSNEHIRQSLLHIPNHEGFGIVIKSTTNKSDGKRLVAAFRPVVSDGKINGAEYVQEEVDFQELGEGDYVVTNAALRCDQHWQINPTTGFPDKCHRSTKNGHERKRVPGHMEIQGDSFSAEMGLPYPSHMLTRVPDELRLWIEEDREARERLLLYTEPLSCCFEAFSPMLMNNEKPDRIAILGDGPNGALLALTATSIFPEATVYVTGKTREKLEQIELINPDKIVTIETQKGDVKIKGADAIKDQIAYEAEQTNLNPEDIKLDVIIPTFNVPNLNTYKERGLIDYEKTRVISWAADQVGNNISFEGLVRPDLIHHSYGGWNQAEWTALQFMTALALYHPDRLEALNGYPIKIFSLEDSVAAINTWLANYGRYMVNMSADEPTSLKIVIDHNLHKDA